MKILGWRRSLYLARQALPTCGFTLALSVSISVASLFPALHGLLLGFVLRLIILVIGGGE
jgi:hypothetical protein